MSIRTARASGMATTTPSSLLASPPLRRAPTRGTPATKEVVEPVEVLCTPAPVVGRKRGRAPNDSKTSDRSNETEGPEHDSPLCLFAAMGAALHPSAVSSESTSSIPSLSCREEETREILTFLSSHIGASTTAALYVCGSPGVGKTAVMTRVLSSLPSALQSSPLLAAPLASPLPSIQVHYMNATPLLSALGSKGAMFDEIRNRIGRGAKKQRTSMSPMEAAYSYNATDDSGEDWITATMHEGSQKPKAAAPIVKATPAKAPVAKPTPVAAGGTDMEAMIAQALARSKFSVLKNHALPLTPHTTLKSAATATTTTPHASTASTASNKPNPRLKYHIVVLDELDVLLTKVSGATAKSKAGVEALNALFAWPQRSSLNRTNNRVLLVGIANAIDMTHKFLPELTAAGCAPQLLMFTPYDASSISRILEQRLTDAYTHAIEKAINSGNGEMKKTALQLIEAAKSQPIFSADGLKMLSMRVANSNGDVRRALEVCATAIGAAAARFCSIKNEALTPATMPGDDTFDADKSVCTQADSPSSSTPSSAAASPLSVEKTARGQRICECCSLPWRPHVPDESTTASTSSAAAGQYAISAVDTSRLLASIFGNRHAKALQALPLQAQVLICAARALVARENTRQQVRASYASLDNRGLLMDDTDGAPEMDLLDPKRKTAALKTRTHISMEDLEGAYHKLCSRMGVTKAPRSEIRDLVERMIGDGLISAAAAGPRGGGSHISARSVSASIGAHLHVNVNAADLDAAFAVSPFYASVATYIHSGLV